MQTPRRLSDFPLSPCVTVSPHGGGVMMFRFKTNSEYFSEKR
jgi:hypothetical protein